MHVAMLWRVCLPGSGKRGTGYVLERTQTVAHTTLALSQDPPIFPCSVQLHLAGSRKFPVCPSSLFPGILHFESISRNMTQRCPHSTRPQCLLAPQGTLHLHLPPRAPLIHRNPSVWSPSLPPFFLAALHTCKTWCGNSCKLNTGWVNRGVGSLLQCGHIIRSLLIITSVPTTCAPRKSG